MEIGTAIKNIRKLKNISQKDLADKVGISNNAMNQIENNNSFPSKTNLKIISKVLNVSIAEILLSCITKEDIPEDKRDIFMYLHETMLKLIRL